VKVAVHGAKAPYGYRKNGIEFFESLVDPFFPLKAVLIGKQMGLTAASGNAVIPTTYGRIDKSAASFSHGKFPPKNNRFSQQNLPNRRMTVGTQLFVVYLPAGCSRQKGRRRARAGTLEAWHAIAWGANPSDGFSRET
jgi:hypothetical protein